jgi:HSP20 family molecular chaperone IbpA
MKLFKHEHKESAPVQEAVEPEVQPVAPEEPPVVPEPSPAATEPAFGHMTQRQDGDDLVITAYMPGLDPDRDVELTVTHGLLHVDAHHREEDTTGDDGYVRREVRYARVLRTLPLPAGVTEADIRATYEDGLLEVRVPAAVATPEPPAATKVPITTT